PLLPPRKPESMLRRRIAEERQALRDAYLEEANPRRLLRSHARLTARAVRAGSEPPAVTGAAPVATGGYGRDELYPASDVDLLALIAGAPDAEQGERMVHLIGALWDAGLEIGHSVRTVEDCLQVAAEDITVRTTLMEARFLAGSRARFRHLVRELDAALD